MYACVNAHLKGIIPIVYYYFYDIQLSKVKQTFSSFINIVWNDIFFMKSNSKNLNIPKNFTTFSSKPITSEASNLARSSAASHSSCAFAYSILTDSSCTC